MTAHGCKTNQLQAILSQINQIHKPATIFVRLILQLSFYLSRSSWNTVMNIQVQKHTATCLTTWEIINCSMKNLNHGVN